MFILVFYLIMSLSLISSLDHQQSLFYNNHQARIQVFGLEGAKLGEGSGDHLGPQSGPGRSPGGGTRGGAKPLRKLLELSDFRARKSCIFMSKLPSPV